MKINGTIVGYDPGGNSGHGLAICSFRNSHIENLEILTCETANDVLERVLCCEDLVAIGVDTLTCWSTGRSGWRPADRWLREKYGEVKNSVASANSLYGSMGLNGMSVLISLLEKVPELHISETHPKVLYYALSREKYNYLKNHSAMDGFLSNVLGAEVSTRNDHEWDAVISVYSTVQGIQKNWLTDLHSLNCQDNERLVMPCGASSYWWP